MHIEDEAEAIGRALAGVSSASFQETWVLQRAVEHGLLIISEAAKTLPLAVKDVAPNVAWRKIETLGNFLRHEHRDVDPELIWSITQDYLPNLLAVARRLADSLYEVEPA